MNILSAPKAYAYFSFPGRSSISANRYAWRVRNYTNFTFYPPTLWGIEWCLNVSGRERNFDRLSEIIKIVINQPQTSLTIVLSRWRFAKSSWLRRNRAIKPTHDFEIWKSPRHKFNAISRRSRGNMRSKLPRDSFRRGPSPWVNRDLAVEVRSFTEIIRTQQWWGIDHFEGWCVFEVRKIFFNAFFDTEKISLKEWHYFGKDFYGDIWKKS